MLSIIALGLISLAGAAQGGTWEGPNNTGIQTFCTKGGVDELLIDYEYDPVSGRPTWQGAFAPCSPTTFDATTFVARGGQPFLGAYRAPTITYNVQPVSLKFFTPLAGDMAEGTHAVKRYSGEAAQALTRIVLETGRPAPSVLANYIGWWWVPAESGTGFSLDIQGTTAFVGIYTYRADGLDDWFISTGALTTATQFEQDLQHCDKATGIVVCTPDARGKLRFVAFYQNNDSRLPRLTLTLPGGEVKVLEPYTR